MVVLVLEDDFEFHSRTFPLMTTVNHFVNDCSQFTFSACIPASSISTVISSVVYRLAIHVSVVISRNHRADCVQLLLALVSCFEPVIRARLLKEKKVTYVQIHEAHNNFHT